MKRGLPVLVNLHTWHRTSAVLVAVFLALLGGCAAPPYHVQTAERAESGQTVVVGRLSVVHDGKETRWGHFQPAHVVVARKGSADAVVHELTRADGMFFWALEPGDYVLAGLVYAKRGGWADAPSSRKLRIWAEFTVPEARSTYIGTLKVVAVDSTYMPRIDDDHTSAFEAFREKFPGQPDPATDLMQIQESIGEYEHVQYACTPGWGIECTRKYHGITPVEPKVEPDAFPEVESLTPTFRWQASSLEDVSYDIVIYEDLTYRLGGIITTHMAGPVVAYKQELTEPVYHHPEKLHPGTKYYWSVRLRRDDIVSNWSRFAFFQFMVFAAKSGQTAWFGFSTPTADYNQAAPR